MLRLNSFSVPLDYTEDSLRHLLVKKLNLAPDQLLSFSVIRRSIDARDKSDVHFVLSLHLTAKKEKSLLSRHPQLAEVSGQTSLPLPQAWFRTPPLVVGAGPAGLFCALTLARAGAHPVLIERGRPVEARTRDVALMTGQGLLQEESNVQFGEGGAGAFSDGKLTCGVRSPFLRDVLETFVRHGAPETILIDPKPHIGTDRLKPVVASIRQEILSLGGTVLFETRLERPLIRDGKIVGAVVTHAGQARELETGTLMLAIGHSARDTVRHLYDAGLTMQQKPFAMGVRIEHPRVLIDRAQYGSFAGHPRLGAASYQLNCHTPDGRGVYTFCMCPGGHVIAAASEPEGVVVNGMSYHARDAENSNSALLVGVRPEDFGSDHPLSGFDLQRRIEQAAWRAGQSAPGSAVPFSAPAQRVEDFLAGRPSSRFGEVQPSYRPAAVPADLAAVLPDYIVANLRRALPALDRQLRFFAHPDAVLTAPETRSSSPVRILRDETGQAVGLSGFYPVGEGAGYAGGIVSAALDGIGAARRALGQAR